MNSHVYVFLGFNWCNKFIIVSFSFLYSSSLIILFKFWSSVSCLYSLDRLSINFAGLWLGGLVIADAASVTTL